MLCERTCLIIFPAGDKEERRSPSGGGGRATPRRPRAHRLALCVYVVSHRMALFACETIGNHRVLVISGVPQPRRRPPGRTPEPSRQLRMLQNDEVAYFFRRLRPRVPRPVRGLSKHSNRDRGPHPRSPTTNQPTNHPVYGTDGVLRTALRSHPGNCGCCKMTK